MSTESKRIVDASMEQPDTTALTVAVIIVLVIALTALVMAIWCVIELNPAEDTAESMKSVFSKGKKLFAPRVLTNAASSPSSS